MILILIVAEKCYGCCTVLEEGKSTAEVLRHSENSKACEKAAKDVPEQNIAREISNGSLDVASGKGSSLENTNHELPIELMAEV